MVLLSNNTSVVTNATNGTYKAYFEEAMVSRFVRWTLLSLILLFGVVGNGMVCLVAYHNRRMRSFSYILITNLAVADLLSAVVGIPVFILNDYEGTWTLGLVLCKLIKPSFPLFNIVVTNSLVAIACERFRGLVFPLSVKPGTRKTRLILVILWLMAFLFALPSYAAMDIQTWPGYDVKYCWEIFHKDKDMNLLYSKMYATFLFLVNNLFPMLIILFLYIKITATLKQMSFLPVALRMLRRSSSDASTLGLTPRQSWNLINPNQAASNRRQIMEKKFIHMLMVVVLVFIVFYVPYQVFFLVTQYHPHIINENSPHSILYLTLYLYLLMWVPVALNPICYGSMNERYKKAFKALIRCSKENKELKGIRRKLSSLQTFLSPSSPVPKLKTNVV